MNKNNNAALLRLAVKSYEKKEMHIDDREAFARDHKQYLKKELTFRELLESIHKPTGELKKAMEAHYAGTVYKRTFKGR